MLSIAISSLAFSGAALRPATGRASVSMAMAPRDMVGVSAPMGFFDPLQFTKDTEKVAYLRDAELKHCRVAMFAVLGWMTTASGYHPLIDALKIAPGATPLSDMNALPSVAWAQIGAFISVVEGFNLLLAKNPNYKPGDLLGASEYMDADDRGWQRYQLAELNNGRLAMIGFMGLLAESAIFNHPLIGLGY